MRRSVLMIALALAAALALPGCAPARVPAPLSEPKPPVPVSASSLRRPLAAIVELRGVDETRTFVRVGLEGSIATLPIVAYGDSDVVASDDAQELLFTPLPSGADPIRANNPGLSEAAELRALDVPSGTSRVVLATTTVTYGYDTHGDVVAITGRGPRYATRFFRDPLTETPLAGARLVTVPRVGARSRAVEVTGFGDKVDDMRFLAADDDSVYVLAKGNAGLHSSRQSVWKLDRRTGRASSLVGYGDNDWAPAGYRWHHLSDWVRLSGPEAICYGLPVISYEQTTAPSGGGVDRQGNPVMGQAFWSNPIAIELYALPAMTVARSLPVTEPPGTSPRIIALSTDLTRYLVKLEDVTQTHGHIPEAILERGPSAEGTIAVREPGLPWPEAMGYVGEDVLFKSYRGPSTEVWLWERKTKSRRRLGLVDGPVTYTFLLGVQYER